MQMDKAIKLLDRLETAAFADRLGNIIMEFGETIKNPAHRILQTEYSGCLDISAHA